MSSENPYLKPIQIHFRRLHSLRWEAPWLPQAVIALALGTILAVLFVLYSTIGIAAQICAMCLELMAEARKKTREARGVERSAYIVSMLVYAFVFLPFWLVQTPVLLVGWGVHSFLESPVRSSIYRPAFAKQYLLHPRLSGTRR